jgi:predicted AAA+ superfamily ATPase
MIPRHLASFVLRALKDRPVVLLNGPRQSGKSTLVQWLASQRHPRRYITFDDAAVQSLAKANPDGFIDGLEGNVAIDEVQRAPEVFLAIKSAVDRKRTAGRFLLTGSANILLVPRLADALVGRMEVLSLLPLSQREIEKSDSTFIDAVFSRNLRLADHSALTRKQLIEKILTGGFPEVVTDIARDRRPAWFRSYVTTMLQRDVRELANIEGLTAMPRLLALLASRAGGLLNFADLSASVGIPQTSLKRYMTLLQTTYLVHLLPPWYGNIGKRLIKTPKVYLMDSGLAAHLLNVNNQQLADDSTLLGHLVEVFVATELLKQLTVSKGTAQLFFFRSQTGSEIDFVLEHSNGSLVAVEVKLSSTVNGSTFTSLNMFAESVGKRFVRGIVLHGGNRVIPFASNMHAMPLHALWTLQP